VPGGTYIIHMPLIPVNEVVDASDEGSVRCIVCVVIERQLANAVVPILVTLLGIVTLVKP